MFWFQNKCLLPVVSFKFTNHRRHFMFVHSSGLVVGKFLQVSQISPPLQTVTGDLTSEPTAAPQICQRSHLRDGGGGGDGT